jgi:type I restriction enzyme S subunit
MTVDWGRFIVADIAAPIKNALVGGPFGSNLVSKDYVEIGIPVIRGKNMGHGRWVSGEFAFVSIEKAESLSANTARPGDLLFTQRGTLGQVAIVPDGPFAKYIVSQSQMKLTVDGSKADICFLYYLFTSPEQLKYIKTNAIQVGVPHTNLGILRNTPIVLPDLYQQKEIVKVLSSLDDKIELNRKINKTLEEIAQAIFKSWFVDFEPVKAKIEAKANGQDPERAAMCAISGKTNDELNQLSPDQLTQLAATAALFPDELVDSALGHIPNGWKVKSIKDWGAVICGKTPPKKEPSFYDGLIPFIKIPDMHGNVFVTTTNDTLSQKGASTQPNKQVPKGSVCVSCIATVGQVVIASETSHTNQQINTVVPSEMSHSYYLFFSMKGRTRLLHDLASGGSATLNLNTGNFSKIPLLFPGDLLLEEYNQKVDSNFMSILLNDRQSQVLASVRDTLLPKLLSGEIDLSENTQFS